MSGWNIVPKMKACRSDLGTCVSVPKPFLGATQGASLKKNLLFLSAICPSNLHPRGADVWISLVPAEPNLPLTVPSVQGYFFLLFQ